MIWKHVQGLVTDERDELLSVPCFDDDYKNKNDMETCKVWKKSIKMSQTQHLIQGG